MEMIVKFKICVICEKRKKISEFGKNTTSKDGLKPQCKKCRSIMAKKYNDKNKEKHSIRSKKYYIENKETINKRNKKYSDNHRDEAVKYRKEYSKKFPWKLTLKNIKSRCEYPKDINYKNYGGRGIKCLITEEELEYLWFRDNAYEMKKPSISRKNHNKNYILDNCKYEEMADNVAERNIRNPKPKKIIE